MEHDMTDTKRKNKERNSCTLVNVFMFQSIVFCSSPILPRPFSVYVNYELLLNYEKIEVKQWADCEHMKSTHTWPFDFFFAQRIHNSFPFFIK